MNPDRTLSWDWYAGSVPANAVLDETAYLESTYSFLSYRSQAPTGVRMGRGASVYVGTMFDVGPKGVVSIGEYSLLNSARIICDREISIGNYVLISWNVLLVDSYRLSQDSATRRDELRRVPFRPNRQLDSGVEARPIRIESNVWIGFDACVLPGVVIGEGSIVGARSVVAEDVPAYTIVAGNPARVVRKIEALETT